MKKIFAILLIIFLAIPSYAKKVDPLDPKQKLDYINIGFWENFSDPYLYKYILQAVSSNHDLRAASWRVEQFRQEVKKYFSKELPSISIGANYFGSHVDVVPALQNSNSFVVPLLATWELDLLLKNWDKVRSSAKDYRANEWDERGTYISLVSDVASAYLNILQYDYLIDSQANLVKVEEELLGKAQNQFKQKTIDAQTLNKRKQSLEDAKNSLNNFLKSRETSLNLFAQLLADAPGTDYERGTLRNFDYRGTIPDEIPSDIIFSRPDVFAAEARLDKAGIDVRVAKKDFFPRFNLLGILVFNTAGPGNFFSWHSILAFLLAGATQDIFKGGLKLAQLRQNKAMYEELFEKYNATSLTALKEVNDALYMVKYDDIIDKNTVKKLALQKDNFTRFQNMQKQGTISRPRLLAEEEELLRLEQSQAQTKTARIVNYFTLYKAVGGSL